MKENKFEKTVFYTGKLRTVEILARITRIVLAPVLWPLYIYWKLTEEEDE